MPTLPKAQGLYDPQCEHDACGIGAVVNISGRRDHAIVEYGKQVLLNLMHRGAAGADESTGDGAGILLQIPHEFFRQPSGRPGFRPCPSPSNTAWRCFSCRETKNCAAGAKRILAELIEDEGLKVLGWRDVPTDNHCLGEIARAAEPVIRQVFIDGEGREDEELERRLVRRPQAGRARAWNELWASRPTSSTSPRCPAARSVYKGMFLAPQLFAYYPDLADERVQTALAIVHQRYSTNTFPSWRLAQPFRMIAHNGEINTLRGNANRLQGCEKTMAAPGVDRRHVGAVSDPPAGRQRLGLFRQLHGAAGPRRPIGAARPDDDDSRGVRAALSHLDRQAGVLRVSRGDHGAVGRPGGDGLHRRPAGRRHAGPQRPAALPLRGHDRRPGGAWPARWA